MNHRPAVHPQPGRAAHPDLGTLAPPRRTVVRTMGVLAALVAAPSASLLTGCALTPWGASAPVAYLVSLERLPGDAAGRRFELQLRLQNPNPKPLTFSGVSLNLDLNNRSVGTGITSAGGVIPARGELEVKVPVSISAPHETLQMLGLNDTLPRGDIPYRVTGRLTGGTLERVLGTEANFEATGSVRLPR